MDWSLGRSFSRAPCKREARLRREANGNILNNILQSVEEKGGGIKTIVFVKN